MTVDLDAINRPDGQHMRPEHVDNVARALLSLTKDVCVLTDRLAILEHVLGEKGIDVAEAVDTYQPDEVLKAEIQARTQRTIDQVVSALRGA